CETVAAELVVPINLGSKEHYSTIGVLSVGFLSSSYKKSHLNQYWNFMTGMVNQAKPMLVYAARLEELNALQNISRQVSRSLNLNEVLDRILQAIVNTLGFEFATISLVDEQNRLVRAKRGINVPQKWLDMAVHALDSSDIQADIIRTGKTEIISDWDNRFDKRIWDKFGHDDMVRVFAPIAVVDDTAHCERIIGTIEAGYHRTTRTEITADQQRLLGAFKTQVSLAIEQAQLLDRVQKKAEVLTSLHHVGQVIASARDLSQVLEEIGHSAAVLLKADIVMLYRYNRDKRVVENPVVYGGVAPKTRLNLDPNQQNILTRLLSETQPYYSADAQSDRLLTALAADADKPGKSKHTFIHVQNIKSFVGIPLMANGEIVGIMFVNYRARHTFDEDEKQVHELFAQQAAVAIKNAEINRLERALVVREERNHLSRELHHSVSQALFGIKLQAQNAMNEIPAPEGNVHTKLSNILEIAHVASNETNFIIEELRSPVEEDRNMVERLEEYIQRVRRWYTLDVVLTHGVTPHLPPEVEQKLFRFAREAINNAVRHSRSRTIRVCCEQNWSHFRLSVQDDGIGFDQKRIPPNKLGLTSMRELAAGIGGSFSLQTAPGYGTMASIQISLDQEAEGHD
ncbi:MAG TPA: GAF domain-containing sensor histidine kinase, partial [Anaerolineae bacterium]